ncbi:MAG: hypothetical protein RIS64_1910 [Bacteroidota bacterium]|jgi:outer membrane protein TolC
MKKIYLFHFLVWGAQISFAQTILTPLTLEQAVQKALQNHIGIKILENSARVAKNNVTKANAGFLPNVNAIASETPSLSYTNQELSNGSKINRFTAGNNFNAGVQMTWTLYDGRRMEATFDRLKEMANMGELNIKMRSEQLIADVMKSYYNVLKNRDLYLALKSQTDLYEARLNLAKIREEVGKGNHLDVLQAQTDLQTQKMLILKQQQFIEPALILLKQVMNVGQEDRFETADTLQIIGNQSITVSKEAVLKNNRAFALNQLQTGILMLSKKETEALLKPRVNFNAAYNFARTDNQAGLILLNQNNGLNAGVSAVYPLYDGGNVKRQVENINIEIESNKLIIKQLENDLWASVQFAQNSYENATAVLKGETEIQTLAQQSLEIAMERYKLGRSTILELKQLQKLYEDSLVRTIIARYDAKFAAIELMRLSGQLLR